MKKPLSSACDTFALLHSHQLTTSQTVARSFQCGPSFVHCPPFQSDHAASSASSRSTHQSCDRLDSGFGSCVGRVSHARVDRIKRRGVPLMIEKLGYLLNHFVKMQFLIKNTHFLTRMLLHGETTNKWWWWWSRKT